MESRGTVRVVMHPVIDDRASPYLVRLGAALHDAGVEVERLRAKSLLGADDPVVHIHWPEHVVRGSGSWFKQRAKWAEAVAITALLARRRTRRVVWTVHNIEPHDGWGGRVEQALFKVMRRRMGAMVTLVPGHEGPVVDRYPELAGVPVFAIEPGGLTVTPPEPKIRPADGPVRCLMIGAIAPYKRQLDILTWLKPAIERAELTLTLVGAVGDPDYLDEIRAVAPPEGVHIDDGWVTDPEMDAIVRAHDIVLAPQAGAFNTGVPYIALPGGTPIGMSPSTQADHLIETQGAQWVRVLPDADDEAGLAALLAWGRQQRPMASPGPWTWTESAEAHRAVYEALGTTSPDRSDQG